MKKWNKWFSILLAMFITTSVILVAIYLLQMAIPFWRNIAWLEKSQSAYYLWLTSAERASYEVKTSLSWANTAPIKQVAWYDQENIKESQFIATWSSTIFPPPWQWDYDKDKNYNIFSSDKPITFYASNANGIENLEIEIKVPPKYKYNSSSMQLEAQNRSIYNPGDATNPIFSWVMYWKNSQGWEVSMNWIITFANLWDNKIDFSSEMEWKFERKDCSSILNVVNGNCWDFDSDEKITFKIYMIKDLKTNHDKDIKNLIYKIDWWTKAISNRYSAIEAEWISRWYKREVNIQATQIPSWISSLDFTVLQ